MLGNVSVRMLRIFAAQDQLCLRAVKFNGLPILVDMRERRVQARFRCQGRINHDPANYKPESVRAQLILYEGPTPVFSVLFDDAEERFRHIMDFGPVPLPCSPSLSWLSCHGVSNHL